MQEKKWAFFYLDKCFTYDSRHKTNEVRKWETGDISNSTKNYKLVTYDNPIGKHKEEVNRCRDRFNFTSEVGWKLVGKFKLIKYISPLRL